MDLATQQAASGKVVSLHVVKMERAVNALEQIKRTDPARYMQILEAENAQLRLGINVEISRLLAADAKTDVRTTFQIGAVVARAESIHHLRQLLVDAS